jgi:cobalt/nickel transport system permease protein
VHLAMLARGWAGQMPRLTDAPATRRQWAFGLAPAVVAFALAVTGWLIT